ncbi:MAG TPA: hypothetical protein EYQ58_00500 [Candidatus Poseidoniales archaeon]|nr:hypothetical protein [Candidatus Poseidoniales archaeon]
MEQKTTNRKKRYIASGITVLAVIILLMGSGAAAPVLSSVGADMSTDEDMQAQQLARLELKIEALTALDTALESCSADLNCEVEQEDLDAMAITIDEKLTHLNTVLADPENAQHPQREARDNNTTLEERLQNRLAKVNNTLAIIQACIDNAECDVGEELLTKMQERLETRKEKMEACLEDKTECKRPGGHGEDGRHGDKDGHGEHEGKRGMKMRGMNSERMAQMQSQQADHDGAEDVEIEALSDLIGESEPMARNSAMEGNFLMSWRSSLTRLLQ